MKITRDTSKPGTWKVDLRVAKRRIRERGFGSRKAAEDFVAELKASAARGKFGLERDRARVTVAALVKEYGGEIDQTRARGRQMKRILQSFEKSLPSDLTLNELSSAHFRDWIKKLRRNGLRRGPLSNGSVNRYLAEVSSMLRAAPSLFVALGDGWRPPRIPWQKDNGRGRERVISAEERSALLEALRFPQARVDGKGLRPEDIAARRDVADCFELALLTGMRGGEVRGLEWSEVDLDEGEIRLPGHKTKTKTPRVVLLNTRALEILRRRRASSHSGSTNVKTSTTCLHSRSRFVFPNEAGDGPRKDISRVIGPVALQLGLRYGRNLPDGFSPHDARHTATTAMLQAGHDMKTVMDVVGHSDKVMTLRYSHSTRQSRRAAVESLQKLASSGQKADKSS